MITLTLDSSGRPVAKVGRRVQHLSRAQLAALRDIVRDVDALLARQETAAWLAVDPDPRRVG